MNRELDLPVPPDDFVGRKQQFYAFRQAVRQGLIAGGTSSFVVLGDWGIGKSRLLLKFTLLPSGPEFAMLPSFRFSFERHSRLLALSRDPTLLGGFADALFAMPNMQARVRRELQNWRFKRTNLGGVVSECETPCLFLSSGSSLLRDMLKEAWERFLRPAQMNGAIFFVDDLHNTRSVGNSDLALTIRNHFQSVGIEDLNYSICLSANAHYFAETKSLADPAPRFYTKLYLEPFTVEETSEYIHSVFGTSPETTAITAAWLQEKTLGHPYFVAFVCRHLAARENQIRFDQLETIWPAIFDQLGCEKFQSDISQLSAKELDLIHRFASLGTGEFRASQFAGKFQREYFTRLVEKRLLICTKRGRYKLYHPQFRDFLRQAQ